LRYGCRRKEVDEVHAPDGFLTAGTAVATAGISAGTIGVALRQLRTQVTEKMVPLAGIVAAFVFAAQMVDFPVAAGTTGHLMGGALAAILLGPHLGALVVAVVVLVQAVFFADGGLTALGYNILNMAIVPAYGGWAAFTLFRRWMPASRGGVLGATALAAWLSVVLSAAAFSILWLFGASAPVPFTRVFAAMVGIHGIIGVGEAVISALAVGAVLASRADLVHGARDLEREQLADGSKVPMRTFLIGGLLAALTVAAIVSQFAVDSPDGLEWVAEEQGFDQVARDHRFEDWVFADYATRGMENETLSLAIAGIVGTLITLLVAWGILQALREKPPTRSRV
jgi:cobalt/nickel transport system permease protein